MSSKHSSLYNFAFSSVGQTKLVIEQCKLAVPSCRGHTPAGTQLKQGSSPLRASAPSQEEPTGFSAVTVSSYMGCRGQMVGGRSS